MEAQSNIAILVYNLTICPFMYLLNKGCRLYHRLYFQRNKCRNLLKIFGLLMTFILTIFIYNHLWNQPPLWYKQVHKSLSANQLNIAVVEEHHEVVQYWFTSVHKSLLPATGNILVHIDGHADSGIPAHVPEMSLFKTPENSQHIKLLMQRNDVFIMAAAYKEFLSRFIWVSPDWVDVSEFGKLAETGEELRVDVGFYDLYHEGKLFTGKCGCYILNNSPDDCVFLDIAGAVIANFTADCLAYRSLAMHVIQASKAPSILPGILAKSNAPVLLDVDEDFFGVMRGSDLLKGIKFELIEDLNELLAKSFTILNIEDETNAHDLLVNILHLIQVVCKPNMTDLKECGEEQFKQIQSYLLERRFQPKLIGNRYLSSGELNALVLYISKNFNVQNMDILSQVGFCLTISPQTYKLDLPEDIQFIIYESIAVCHGVNTPYSTNQIYEPSKENMETNIDKYETVLKSVPNNRVKLVTVCRSNRDGFTPRRLQQEIEEVVINSLKAKFTKTNLIYDPNLMMHLQ